MIVLILAELPLLSRSRIPTLIHNSPYQDIFESVTNLSLSSIHLSIISQYYNNNAGWASDCCQLSRIVSAQSLVLAQNSESMRYIDCFYQPLNMEGTNIRFIVTLSSCDNMLDTSLNARFTHSCLFLIDCTCISERIRHLKQFYNSRFSKEQVGMNESDALKARGATIKWAPFAKSC